MFTCKRIAKLQQYYLHDLNFFSLCSSAKYSYYLNFEKISSQYHDLNLKDHEFCSFLGGLMQRSKFGFVREFYDIGFKFRNLKLDHENLFRFNFFSSYSPRQILK